MFFKFLKEIKGTVAQIDCMIEAKEKDQALFNLIKAVEKREDIEMIDGSTFYLK